MNEESFRACLTLSAYSRARNVVVHAPKGDLTLETARTELRESRALMDRGRASRRTRGCCSFFERDERVDFG